MGEVKDCKHSILDKLWGEWKCKKKSHIIKHPENMCDTCKDYVKDPHKVIDISEDD